MADVFLLGANDSESWRCFQAVADPSYYPSSISIISPLRICFGLRASDFEFLILMPFARYCILRCHARSFGIKKSSFSASISIRRFVIDLPRCAEAPWECRQVAGCFTSMCRLAPKFDAATSNHRQPELEIETLNWRRHAPANSIGRSALCPAIT
jgi:hypothetical protein